MNGNPYYKPYWLNDDELEHHGIKGQRWGVRRYQNEDGSLTTAGKKRYNESEKTYISTTVISSQRLGAAWETYEAMGERYAKRALDVTRKVAYVTGIPQINSLTGDVKDAMWNASNMAALNDIENDQVKELLGIYVILQAYGLEGAFSLRIYNASDGSRKLKFVHNDTGKQFDSISAAKSWFNIHGTKQREKNVTGAPVSIKVNKDKPVVGGPSQSIPSGSKVLTDAADKKKKEVADRVGNALQSVLKQKLNGKLKK